jgi:hypothetical protein
MANISYIVNITLNCKQESVIIIATDHFAHATKSRLSSSLLNPFLLHDRSFQGLCREFAGTLSLKTLSRFLDIPLGEARREREGKGR